MSFVSLLGKIVPVLQRAKLDLHFIVFCNFRMSFGVNPIKLKILYIYRKIHFSVLRSPVSCIGKILTCVLNALAYRYKISENIL